MSDYGVIVTLPGYDVKDATPEQCAVHSKYDTFKVQKGSTPAHFGVIDLLFNTDPAAGTTTTIKNVAHGYDYMPATVCHWETDFDTGSLKYGTCALALDAAANTYFDAYANESHFKIDFVKTASSVLDVTGRTFRFRYYIFAEDGD